MLTLHIGNKNYSSWSMRPWLLMKQLAIPFQEELHWLYEKENLKGFSPSGTVPCLVDGELVLWDSLAIVEHLAETHAAVWPADKKVRAWARSATAEMHSGFTGLRGECSMNCGVRVRRFAISVALQKDIDRINALWEEGITRFGGPFLAGKQFTAVDAFYAPIAYRFQSYGLPLSPVAKKYQQMLFALPALQEWYAAGIAETVRIPGVEAWMATVGIVEQDFRAK